MMAAQKILFVVTEDWFFASHFLSVAVAARAAGYEVAVTVRVRDPVLRARIEQAGVRVIPSRHQRGRFGPLAMVGHVQGFAMLFRAALLAGVRRRVQAVTGLGLIGASPTLKARLARGALGLALRGPLGGKAVRYVFENREDPALLGMDPDGPRVRIVGGAGIDPDRERRQPLPPLPPLRIAVVARMVHSKGVDVAVEALRRARAAGAQVVLSLFGAPDPDNPRSLSADTLRAWSTEPGIAWHGHAADIAAVWRDHHIVCVPSRGGEGLPRSLLEGAAAGRAVVTTLTPGCATFTRDGVEGFVVPPGDPEALADVFVTLAHDPDLVARFGEAARLRVLDGFTTVQVARDFLAVYRDLAGPQGGRP